MAGPIKPSAVASKQAEAIPEPVFEAFNELIAEGWNGACAVVKQEDVVMLILKKTKVARRDMPHFWLNVEDAYRKAGWRVKYDKPGYNETYPATFDFSKR